MNKKAINIPKIIKINLKPRISFKNKRKKQKNIKPLKKSKLTIHKLHNLPILEKYEQ